MRFYVHQYKYVFFFPPNYNTFLITVIELIETILIKRKSITFGNILIHTSSGMKVKGLLRK